MNNDVEFKLVDGSTPWTADRLLGKLDELSITHQTIQHPPLYTVKHSKAHRQGLTGGFSKNLFLRNKKGQMWLLTCLEDRQIDLKCFARLAGAGRFSFASAERLMKYLGVVPGAVTPFAVVNDCEGKVKMLLDRGLLEFDPLNFHPLDNAQTTTIARDDLLKFLQAVDHPPEIVDLDPLEITSF